MACRRTRIKGIANIPQRRKTGIQDEHAECDSKIEIQHELEACQDNAPNATVNSLNCEKIDEPNGLLEILNDKVENKGGNEEHANVRAEQNRPPIIRRKFIKPMVALGAINRKNKDNDITEKNKGTDLIKPDAGAKIIILDQTIIPASQAKIDNRQKQIEGTIIDLEQQPLLHTLKDVKRLRPPSVTGQDVEYPVPPASPTKINRSRIKAIPRFGQRHHSVSASESEDENKRNNRIRNDSLCSTTSGAPDSIPDCSVPQKKEFNSVIQRKCRRTEQSRKLAEARRDFYYKFGNNKPDRQKLTMMDLIFYNPTTNLMTHETKKKIEDDPKPINDNEEKEEGNEQEAGEEEEEEEVNEESVDKSEKATASDEENAFPAPQIKIGPDGEIVVDEQSLVIESETVKKNREKMKKSKMIDGDFETTYGLYKRAKRSKDWTKQETLKFYKALNTIGTDFTLMCELFPRRSRRELKQKFKKEEKINRTLIDRAVMQPCNFDFNEFKQEVELEEKELQFAEKQKDLDQQNRKKRKLVTFAQKGPANSIKKVKKEKQKRDSLNITSLLEGSDEEADISDVDSNVEEDETEDTILRNMQRPTRSGRVPKILDRYKAPNEEQKKIEPGSLMVVASSGPTGDPVYKVFMVTPEKQKHASLGNGVVSTLTKAVEGGGALSGGNILTVSVTTNFENAEEVDDNVNSSDKSNVTIPTDNNVSKSESVENIKEADSITV